MRFISVALSLALVGCASSPHQSNFVGNGYVAVPKPASEAELTFKILNEQNVDMRGIHSKDDSVEGAAVLYQGGAGLAGLLVQIGTHAALVKGQRAGKLSAQQEEANKKISSLIEITNGIPPLDLVGMHRSQFVTADEKGAHTISMEPVFFSNESMTRISLDLTLWTAESKGDGAHDGAFKYQNRLKVHAPKLTEEQSGAFVKGDRSYISETLSFLLQTAIHIIKQDATGQLDNTQNPVKTYHLESDSGRRVLRGRSLVNKCGFQVVRDIRSSIVIFPSSKAGEYKGLTDSYQCLVSSQVIVDAR